MDQLRGTTGGESVDGDPNRAMDHDRFTKHGRHDVKLTPEWQEDIAVGDLANRSEPVPFTDQGHSAANHDPSRSEQRDDLRQGKCKRRASRFEDIGRIGVTACRSFGDDRRRDRLRVEVGFRKDGPLGLSFRESSLRDFPSGRLNRPARGDQLKLAPSTGASFAAWNAQVPDLGRTQPAPR